MKTGIVILFFNNEHDIDNTLIASIFNHEKASSLCFVNNGSKDRTLEVLKSLKEDYQSKVHIVDVKKHKGPDQAIKAGARYLLNKIELNHIGYIKMYDLKDFKSLEKLLMFMQNDMDSIVKAHFKSLEYQQTQRLLLKNIFSILEFYKELKGKFNFNGLGTSPLKPEYFL